MAYQSQFQPPSSGFTFQPPPNAPRMGQSTKHLTCRYWFYSTTGCPDSERQCPYSHRDTGTLTNYSSQRGTCWHWKHVVCNRPHKCLYEHRETGVCNDIPPKKGQQREWHRHKLTGLNLTIANAAQSSGFDVSNKPALMQLVFAVRRAGGLQDLDEPREAPLYPDYYRPAKRAWAGPEETGHIGRHAVTTADGDTSLKRQKVNFDVIPNHSQGGRARDMKESARRPTDRRSPSPHTAPKTTMDTLRMVRQTFEDIDKTIHQCVDDMKDLWERDHRMREQAVMPILVDLREDFENGRKASHDGLITLDKVMRAIH